jgi:hypothetical protein
MNNRLLLAEKLVFSAVNINIEQKFNFYSVGGAFGVRFSSFLKLFSL